jgi:hypothetical protein
MPMGPALPPSSLPSPRFPPRQEHAFVEKMLSAMVQPNSPRISMTAIGSSPGNALAFVLTGVSGSAWQIRRKLRK